MVYHKRHTITAILVMAVIAIGLLATGCATKRDVKDINARLDRIEANVKSSRDLVAHMDSLISATTESNRLLQNDVRSSTEELTQQMSQLMQGYNDLMSRINQMSGPKTVYLPPTSSPGASGGQTQDTAMTTTPPPPPPGTMVNQECVDVYDSSFQMVRRGDYEQAIAGFERFMADCPNHENVPNALYWIGESYFSQDKYTQANEQYQKLIESYPDSPKLSQAIYKSARCNQELGKKAEAKKLYQQLVKDFAGTLEARQAEERLKDL